MSEELQGVVAPSAPAPQAGETDASTADVSVETPPEAKRFTQAELDEAIQKRIAKESRRYQRDSDRRVAEAYERALKRDGGNQTPAPKPAVETDDDPNAPKREDFDTYEKYIRADARYYAAKELTAQQETARQREQTTRSQQTEQSLRQKFEKTLPAARAKYADFDDVIESAEDVQVPNHVRFAMFESDLTHDLTYYFAKNPTEMQRIAALQPVAAIREIGKLEAKLAATPAPTKELTNAPAPIDPVSGKGGSTSGLPSDADDTETWIRKRQKQVHRR